jgi:hypothetical protein
MLVTVVHEYVFDCCKTKRPKEEMQKHKKKTLCIIKTK